MPGASENPSPHYIIIQTIPRKNASLLLIHN